MKILIYADPHWSQYSSIVRTRGESFSTRLENLIESINWVEDLAKQRRCDSIVCLGDFFDKSELNAEEITALGRIGWYDAIPHHFLVGNHEMGANDLSLNSAKLFRLLNNAYVESLPNSFVVDNGETLIVFIPYILESRRLDMVKDVGKSELLPLWIDKEKSGATRTIIFSHNDLQIQYGAYKSVCGFTEEEINKSCDLFINGHIHNFGQQSNIVNLGNLTGQNFSEDAFKYNHYAMILDTETLKYEFIANPYAMQFVKLDFSAGVDQSALDKLPDRSVVSVKVNEGDYDSVKKQLDENSKVITYRITVERTATPVEDVAEFHFDDHLTQFVNFIKETVGDSDIVSEELQEICK